MRGRRTLTQALVAVCFVSGFAGMVWVGELLPRGVRNELYVWQRSLRVDASWKRMKVDGHHEIYAGRYGLIDSARRADVLLLGNSRAMFAFRQEQIQELAQRSGARLFHLGFGYEEKVGFPLSVIRKHDLRPKMVIVNADGFFVPGISELARQATAEAEVPAGTLAKWHRRTSDFEERLSGEVKAALQPWLPRWGLGLPSGLEPLRQLRSTIDGSWMSAGFDAVDRHLPFTSPEAPDPYRLGDGERSAIQEFKAEMDRRDVTIVLTLVPHPRASRSRAESVAAALGAPLVAPPVEGLSTLDGSHLDRDSARRFMAAFLEELETLGLYPTSPPPSTPGRRPG